MKATSALDRPIELTTENVVRLSIAATAFVIAVLVVSQSGVFGIVVSPFAFFIAQLALAKSIGIAAWKLLAAGLVLIAIVKNLGWAICIGSPLIGGFIAAALGNRSGEVALTFIASAVLTFALAHALMGAETAELPETKNGERIRLGLSIILSRKFGFERGAFDNSSARESADTAVITPVPERLFMEFGSSPEALRSVLAQKGFVLVELTEDSLVISMQFNDRTAIDIAKRGTETIPNHVQKGALFA